MIKKYFLIFYILIFNISIFCDGVYVTPDKTIAIEFFSPVESGDTYIFYWDLINNILLESEVKQNIRDVEMTSDGILCYSTKIERPENNTGVVMPESDNDITLWSKDRYSINGFELENRFRTRS